MLDDLLSLEIFLLLCENGSIQKTAEVLNIDKSVASRKLTKLEKRLGRRLFEHDRRPLMMTPDAQAILASVRKIVEEKQVIENYYRRLHDKKSMMIRLMIGNSHINFAPKLLAEYSDMFPDISFNVISPTEVQDFLAGKADVICLSGQAELSNCIMLPRGNMIFIPVASPDYIRRYGKIQHPDQLSGHRVFSNLYRSRFDFTINFQLKRGDKSVAVQAKNTIRFSNVQMTREAVLQGHGIALSLPLFLCIDDLESGRLVPILNGWHRPSHINYVACKEEDWKIQTIRSFADWWAKKLLAYEKECESRLVKLYDRDFLLNLMH